MFSLPLQFSANMATSSDTRPLAIALVVSEQATSEKIIITRPEAETKVYQISVFDFAVTTCQAPKQKGSMTELFTILAETLQFFSIDLVKLVHSYLFFQTAKPGAQPRFLFAVGSGTKRHEAGHFTGSCFGVACNPANGTIWVSSEERVQVFSSEGVFLHPASARVWSYAMGIAFSSRGEIVIADRGNDCLVVCSQDGEFERLILVLLLVIHQGHPQRSRSELRKIGSAGEAPGHFANPCYVAFDNEDRVYVTDSNKVQVLKLDSGECVRSWEIQRNEHMYFHGPRGLAVNSEQGEVAISDMNHHIQVRSLFGCFSAFSCVFSCAFWLCVSALASYSLGLCVRFSIWRANFFAHSAAAATRLVNFNIRMA